MLDLHFHSTNSDGKYSVSELAELIKTKGLRYCALTDHDSVAGIKELRDGLAGSGAVVIPGVELTALYGDNEIHVVAYDFEVGVVEEILRERNKIVKKQKIEEMKMAVELFKKEGIIVTDNLEPVEKKPVGYTLAVDICQNQSNQELFSRRHGKILTTDELYFEYSAPDKSCFVKRSGVTLEWLLEKLKDKAADFIIAHPFLRVSVVMKPLSEIDISNILNLGVTGVEVYHNKTSEQQIKFLEKLVKVNDLHYTGGSDFHGRKDDAKLGFYGIDVEIPGFKLSNYELI